jgi:CheY-like chemotaxis protein
MAKQPIYILLADDDEDDRDFFRDALEELKINTIVTFVNDGSQLMQYLERPDIILPHLIFLDLNMPLMSGMECLKEIRSNERLRHLSVAIYSTSASDEHIEETFVKGANVYIRKPNDFSTLKKVLQEVISVNWQYHTSALNKENFLFSI